MSTATVGPANGTDRAALLRAAKGTPSAPGQELPMGIRVTAGPGVPPAPAESTPGMARRTLEELLRTAASSKAVRTRKLAAKITGLVEELIGQVEAEETARREREAAEARRRELAEAEAKLASKLAEVRQELRATGTRDSAPSRNRREGAAERAAIREWALANGYEVKDRGRLSQEIRKAYDAAIGPEVTR